MIIKLKVLERSHDGHIFKFSFAFTEFVFVHLTL